MELAVAEATRSQTERLDAPKVDVAVAREGLLLASAHRGELRQGEHAEYTAIEP